MSFIKGSVLEQLQSYGLVLGSSTVDIAESLKKKKAILARRQIRRQARKLIFQEHLRNDVSGCIF
jgi:hypothetical protein